jgi:tetratricopeptide (TPR) repeat protein
MPSEDYPRLITVLRMLLRLNTEHEVARNNLAIAFQRYGIQKESEGDYNAALELFHLALSIASDLDITSSVKRSFSVVFTSMGIQLYQSSDFLGACKRMRQACEIYPTEVTRRNLMMANAHVAFFHLSRNELEMAKECFERTQDAGLSTPELLNAYGVALARLGHLSDAVWQFRRGLKLSPGDTVIKENLMIINSSLGAGFSTTPISTGFVPVPPMEPQEFQMAA